MPIIHRQGSLNIQSSREQPIDLLPEVQNKHPVLNNQALLDEVVIEKTFLNNSSFNEDSFKQNRSLVAGYPEGRIILVTYYSQVKPRTDLESAPVDLVMKTKDDVHIEWLEIRNFELRCSNEISFNYVEDNNISEVESEAIVLPGFEPRISDIFLYGVRNDKIGLFNVSNVQRLALGQETYHRITFTMQEWLTAPRRDQLHRQSKVWYFDKTKFLVGNNAMLSTEGFIQQKDLKHIRKEIVQNYVDRFFDNSYGSFMRPDEMYDPYVVEYWNKKVSYRDSYVRPTQLLISVANYKKTIWAVLTNNPIKDLRNVAHVETNSVYAQTFWGSNITSLLGTSFVIIGDDEGAIMNPATGQSYNNPVLYDSTPFFHMDTHSKAHKEVTDAYFDADRRRFYKDFLPYRKCAPHQHPVDLPNPCNEEDCIECQKTADGVTLIVPRDRPPYPVISNRELFNLWCKMHYITAEQRTEQVIIDQFKGYLLWYRENRPGSYSREDLEEKWRALAEIPPNKELVESEKLALREYIRSYRSQFVPVLHDRKLEIIWRTKLDVAMDETLDTVHMDSLKKFIQAYRREHGNVPNDGEFPPVFPVLGSPVSSEELATVEDTSDTFDIGSSLVPIEPTIPHVYVEQHPRPHHELHCHSVCHKECGVHSKDKKKNTIDTSSCCGLSYEFYIGSDVMSPFERLLYNCITGKEINVALILDTVKQYLDLSDEDAFYMHLYFLYLIDKGLYWLRFHS